MTAPVRERTARAIRASWMTREFLRSIGRSLLVASAVAVVLSLIGAFGIGDEPLVARTLILVATFCAGSLIGMSCFTLAGLIRPLTRNIWLHALGGGLIMIAPMALMIWGVSAAFVGMRAASSELDQIVSQAAVLSIAMTFLSVAINRGAEAIALTVSSETPPPFLDRIPARLRGGELWAVESEDHYLRLHTSRGQDLILMRLADAVRELDGIEGAQVHRSWWVARQAITETDRHDGRATLTLKDGSKVPVSRTYARLLRDHGWV